MRRGYRNLKQKDKSTRNIMIVMVVSVFFLVTGYSAFQTVINLNAKGTVNDLTKEYVSNQLILHLDGIKNTRNGHNSNTTSWEDLSGNNKDGLIIDGQWDDKSLIYNGNTTGVYYEDGLKDLFDYSNTVEIRLIFNVPNTRDIIIGNYNGTTGTGFVSYEKSKGTSDRSRIWFDNAKIDTELNYKYETNVIQTLSFVYDKENNRVTQYVNGEFVEKLDNIVDLGNSSRFTNAYIGRDVRTGGTVLDGKVFAVRMYSRQLSDSEIKQNYNLDKKRLN